jgi:hypothetical protein
MHFELLVVHGFENSYLDNPKHEHQIFAGNPYVRKTFYNSINRRWDYRKKELERF